MDSIPQGHLSFERERGVSGIEVSPGVAHLTVAIGDGSGRSAQLGRLFQSLAQAAVPIFLIKLHATSATFAVETASVDAAVAAVSAAGLNAASRQGLALVSIHASNVRDLTGVMVKAVDALHEAGARLYGAGDSHSSIQCLIEGSAADRSAGRLRRTFGLEKADG